jgi:molybdopterin converting factor small subunit
MQVNVILHSILREKLPVEARGRATLAFQDGARVRDVMARLELPANLVWAVNERIDRDPDRLLADGDTLRFMRPGAGG